MTGQEAATLTARFNDDIGITGAILTKLDGDTRGGSALSVRGVSGKPIKFIGVGEGMDDLEPFFPDRMASRILGMGDIQSLIEKANQAYSMEEGKAQAKKMQSGTFDFNDYLFQTQAMRKMGGIAGMMKNLPGGMSRNFKEEDIYQLEQKFKRCEAIIAAMTPEERSQPDLVAAQGGKKELVQSAFVRRSELAKQVGVSDREVDAFISEFNNMRRMMAKQFKVRRILLLLLIIVIVISHFYFPY
jgi:signal recognition particle subunit SRP54